MRAARRLALLLVLLVAATSLAAPALALQHQKWSLSLTTGSVTGGDFTSNLDSGYWHISGTIRDRYAGDDCTRVNLYEEQDSDRMALVKTYKVCGGGSLLMDYDDYALGDTVRVVLCQDYWAGCRSQVTKTLYLLPA